MIKCTNCGTMLEPDSRFCKACGTPVEVAKPLSCESCGAELSADSLFCTQCGAPVKKAEPMKDKSSKEEDFQPPIYTEPPVDQQPKEEFDDQPKVDVTFVETDEDVVLQDIPEESDSRQRVVNDKPVSDDEVEVVETFAPDDNAYYDETGEVILVENLHELEEEGPDFVKGDASELEAELFPDSEAEKKSAKKKKPVSEKKLKADKPKTGKAKRVLITIVIVLIALILVLWLFIIPRSLKGKEGEPTITEEPIVIEKEPPTLPEEPAISTDQSNVKKDIKYTAEIFLDPKWDEVKAFDNEGVAAVKEGNKWGLIDMNGEYILPPTYSIIYDFNEGVAVVADAENNHGYIDTLGNEIVPLEYDSALSFNDGMGVVIKDSEFLFVTASGRIRNFGGERTTGFHDGYAGINGGESAYFIDENGKKVSQDYDEVGYFSQGLAPVSQDGLWGYIDEGFEMIIPYAYEEANAFNDGFAIVGEDGKKFLIDTFGEICSPKVDEIMEMQDGIATVKKSGLYGFIDGKSTDYLIEPQYLDVYAFSENVAAVSYNKGIWYYVDKDNNPISTNTFDEAFRFVDGFAVVNVGLDYTVIDKTGNIVIEESWRGVGNYGNSLLPVKIEDKWGYIELVKK